MKIIPQALVSWLHARTAPVAKRQVRMYQSAKNSRLTAGWSAPTTSADTELYTSLRVLRGRSRALVRDAAYAKRAKVVVVNNVIGAGMGMQGNVRTADAKLLKAVNDGIESAWTEWARAENCHTGGAMHFNDLERAAMGQVFEAGEVFLRIHPRPFGRSKVPIGIELIEAERIADDYAWPVGASGTNQVKMGIEVDSFGRAVAYWVRELHPSEVRVNINATDKLIRVPAEQMIHLRIVDRWPQTRGEPWMHATARRLNDMDGYSEAEIVAARASAAYMAFIIDPNGTTALGDAPEADGTKTITMEPGIVETLGPGEDIRFHDPNRPNTAIDPFLRYMLREVAAGVGVSYESLSRDYSQSNYSSSRLALLDDRDLWRTLQQWWIRSLREPLHRIWLQQAVFSGAVSGMSLEAYMNNAAKYEAVKFKPRGWNWVDPTKEVEAYKEAVLAGFTTVSDVIAQTGNGRDLEDVLQERASELEMMEELDLEFDTEYVKPPEAAPAPAMAEPAEPEDPEEAPDTAAETARVMTDAVERLASLFVNALTDQAKANAAQKIVVMNSMPERSVTVEAPNITVEPTVVNLTVPERSVTVEGTNVNVEAPQITVEAAPAPETIVNVAAPNVTVEAPNVTVEAARVEIPEQAAPVVNVTVPEPVEREQVIERDGKGEISRVVTRNLKKRTG